MRQRTDEPRMWGTPTGQLILGVPQDKASKEKQWEQITINQDTLETYPPNAWGPWFEFSFWVSNEKKTFLRQLKKAEH